MIDSNAGETILQAISERQRWLATLAHAPRSPLEATFAAHVGVALENRFEWLRVPEIGLTMVRARVGGTGDRFNVGEITVTRCVARFPDRDGRATGGVGYVKGRDPERARWTAMLDALLQHADHHQRLVAAVVEPLQVVVAARQAGERAAAETSRVRFFTLQPGMP